MIKFTIPLKVNSQYGLNKIYSGQHWRKRQATADEIHTLTRIHMKLQKVPKIMFKEPVTIIFYWDTTLDLDNTGYMRKLIIDGMKGYLLQDDDKGCVCELIDRINKKDGIIVEVREFNE